jgi:hypothetical protein
MDSMIAQRMVSKPSTAVTARIDHQGVCVGQAVTAMMDITKPNAKTIPYCPGLEISKFQFFWSERRRERR